MQTAGMHPKSDGSNPKVIRSPKPETAAPGSARTFLAFRFLASFAKEQQRDGAADLVRPDDAEPLLQKGAIDQFLRRGAAEAALAYFCHRETPQ
jgi:hypothetical protein